MPVKILVVDDEADLEMLINQKFRREVRAGKITLLYARNGKQALDLLDQHQDVGLVLTDLNMPEMDGLTLLTRINERHLDLQTIVVSAYGDLDNIRAAMNRGAFDFLVKPIDFEDLKLTIAKTVRRIDEIKQFHEVRRQKSAAEDKAAREEQKARDAQAKMIEHLRRMDKLKDEFLANTSHELRTPINGIIGLVDALMDSRKNFDGDTRATFKLINETSKRLTGLIDDILDFSQIESGNFKLDPRPVHLATAVERAMLLSRALMGTKTLSLENLISKDMPAVMVDPNRLQQILVNLIGNAIKFTEKGGVTITAEQRDGMIHIAVNDTGIGISKEHREAIFDTFRQLAESNTRTQGGVGLGLAITRKLVDLCGGEIELESTLGEGSCFSFSLPFTDAAPEIIYEPIKTVSLQPKPISLKQTGPEEMLNRKDHLILAVDDEPVNRMVMQQLLSVNGYNVELAPDGPTALEMMSAKRYDLVILDVMMPGMSGLEVCRQIRDEHSLYDLPVIMVTARTQVKDLLAGIESGANDYLGKPFDKREFLARVRTLLSLRDAVGTALQREKELKDEQVRAMMLEQEKSELAYRAQESARAEAQAKEVSRQKTDFLALMSHELRTPLNAIIGYSEILHEDVTESGKTQWISDILKIKNSARNLLGLINNLLDLTKIEAGKMEIFVEEFRLALLFEEIQNTIEPLASKNNNTLHFSVEEDLDAISADIIKLRQVMLNLLGNACKFTQNGHIRVHAEKVTHRDEPGIRITVADDGIGMSEVQQARLFRPFTQADKTTMRNYGGTGLGLTICKRFLELMNGDITVSSRQNEGATFSVMLPAGATSSVSEQV